MAWDLCHRGSCEPEQHGSWDSASPHLSSPARTKQSPLPAGLWLLLSAYCVEKTVHVRAAECVSAIIDELGWGRTSKMRGVQVKPSLRGGIRLYERANISMLECQQEFHAVGLATKVIWLSPLRATGDDF